MGFKSANAPPATMGFNSAVIKPETRVNTPEDAGQPLEKPKCKTCNDTKRKSVKIGGIFEWEDCRDCLPEQPDLKIIEEIEGLISKVNDKIYILPISSLDRKELRAKALEEIDLFQKTTLCELRKSFTNNE